MNLAGGPNSTALTLTVIDDHSDPECLSSINDLLRTGNFSSELISLKETGNGPSLKFTYELAHDRAQHLIYFVEDDYLHSPEAITEMLSAQQQFSFFLKQDVVLFPCDGPENYLQIQATPILCSDTRHWRVTNRTTGTNLVSKKTLIDYWDRYMALTKYNPFNDVCEDNTINLIYKTVPCLSPMPSLAMHVVDSTTLPPLVNWTEWWMQSEPKSQQNSCPHPIVDLPPEFADERGGILPLVDEAMKSAVLIHSKKSSVRANHYHKTDWHYCYLLNGEINYYYRPAGNREKPLCCKIKAGQMFFTPPLVEHAFVFAEDSTFICFGRNSRNQASYEADIVRVQVYP